MLLRFLSILLLSFTLMAGPAFAGDAGGAGEDERCPTDIREAQQEQSSEMIDTSNEVRNDLSPSVAPTAGMACLDRIVSDWAQIGSIFSDTGDLDEKLIDHATTFAIPFISEWLGGSFDIGGITFSFDLSSVVMDLVGDLAGDLLGGGGFGQAFSGPCDTMNDFTQDIEEQVTEEVKNGFYEKFRAAQQPRIENPRIGPPD
jgi:hypothetical protein